MDVSMQMRDLANAVGEDFAMNAPDDTARLVGRARRGRMVWSTGVGAAVVGSAASLAFGGPALASVLTSGPEVAPAGTTSSSPSATETTPTPDASVTPSPSTAPPATFTPLPGAGTIDLSGGGATGDDDSADHDANDDHGDDGIDDVGDDHGDDGVDDVDDDHGDDRGDDSVDDVNDDHGGDDSGDDHGGDDSDDDSGDDD